MVGFGCLIAQKTNISNRGDKKAKNNSLNQIWWQNLHNLSVKEWENQMIVYNPENNQYNITDYKIKMLFC